MSRYAKLLSVAGIVALGLAGCGEESAVTKTTEITGPDGRATITEQRKIETDGTPPVVPAPAPSTIPNP